MTAALLVSACASMNRTQKGAVVGTATGAAMGAIIGEALDNPALGAIIGATVGGATGAVIGNQMDKQAAEIEQAVPDAKVERVGEGIVVEFANNILFGFDRYDLSSEAQGNLDKLVVVLNEYPDTDIEIQGHTDSSGSESYNQTLSEQRAASVSSYLISGGIENLRINTVGFGETTPKYDNSTGEGRAQNRRVEFLITANEKMISEAAEEANE
ncbi:MAG: OmpA family protein [Bacteroidales bacterium]|nr:OmpA family protein [Bacteroidales bacterium]